MSSCMYIVVQLHVYCSRGFCAVAKGRINTELRENFILPEGASQSRISFVPRRSSVTTPSSSMFSRYRTIFLLTYVLKTITE